MSSREQRGDRRVVTMLFADVVGSTSVAEQMDPEEWADIADAALTRMSWVIGRYGGTVARLMGDGVLAFFGAPTAHEDDAERAVRAAWEIVAEMETFRSTTSARLESTGIDLSGDRLWVRVGVNTGPVVAGAVGDGPNAEYTALGDAVNLAARLEQTADPGTIRISDATRRLVEHAAIVEPMGSIEVKGKRLPVLVHAVTGVRQWREEPRAAESAVPIVGRDEERRALREMIAATVEGHGGLASLVGEAGLGKSRLLDDVLTETDGILRHITATCLSFEATSPHALTRRLLHLLGFDTETGALRALGHLTRNRAVLLSEVLTALAHGDPGAFSGPDPGTALETAATAFGEALTGSIAADGPTAIVIDDVHWVDGASAELLELALHSIKRLPVLFLLATRPDRDGHGRRLRTTAERVLAHRYREILIGPLPRDGALELAARLLDGTTDDIELAGRLADRADGNPYFLEELARELRLHRTEGQTVAAERVDIPDTLQLLLQARIDRLAHGSRETVETAAVIGRRFTRSLLETARRAPVDRDLAGLVSAGLVDPDDTPGGYRFRHALAQEAVLAAILRKRLRALHLTVGEALEQEAAGDPSNAPVLAEHFALAGDLRRAASYALVAGEEAAGLFALTDALGHFDRGVDAARDDDDPAKTAALLRGRGRVRDLLGDLEGARSDLEEALATATDAGLAEETWATLIALGESLAATDYEQTGTMFRRALDVARSSGDPIMLGTSLNRYGNWHVNASDPARGIALHEEALHLFESSGSREGTTASHDLLAMAHLLGGDRQRSRDHYDRALEGFRSIGDRAGIAGALISRSIGAPSYEEWVLAPTITTEEGLASLDEALDLVETMTWPAGEAYARFVRSQVLACGGDLGPAIREGRRALEIARTIGHDQWAVATLMCLGAAEGDAFAFEDARLHLEEAVAGAHDLGSRNWILQASAALGMVLVEAGDADGAVEVVGRAMALPDATSFLPGRSCLLVSARAAIASGRQDLAVERLSRLEEHIGGAETGPYVSFVRGLVLAGTDPDAAMASLSDALDVAGRWMFAPALWRIHLAIAGRLTGPGGAVHRAHAARVLDRSASGLDGTSARRMRERSSRLVGTR
jgi:class 3 adenylate cyclase/tetratricopeptide (TPR) repeat protein